MALIESEEIVPLPPDNTDTDTINDAVIQLQKIVAKLVGVDLDIPEEFDPSNLEAELASTKARVEELEDNPAITRWFGGKEDKEQGWELAALGLYFQIGRLSMDAGAGNYTFAEAFPNNCVHVFLTQDRLPPDAQSNEQAIDGSSLSSTGFNYHNLNSSNAPVAFIAIGY